MGILERISQLVKANINDLIESARNSERALEKHVEEMEEDLADARTVLVATRRQEGQVAARVRRRETEARSWEERAAAALRGGKDHLAREAVRRKLEAERRAADLREEHAEIEARVGQLEEAIQPLEKRLSEARARLEQLIREKQVAERDREFQRISASLGNGVPEASERFEEEARQAQFQADAIREVASSTTEARFRALEDTSSDEVELELARIKQEVSEQQEPPKEKAKRRKN